MDPPLLLSLMLITQTDFVSLDVIRMLAFKELMETISPTLAFKDAH